MGRARVISLKQGRIPAFLEALIHDLQNALLNPSNFKMVWKGKPL